MAESSSVVPQIILNVQRGTARQSLTTEFIIGTTFARLVLPVYFYGYSDNVLDVDVSRESPFSRSPLLELMTDLHLTSFQLGSTFSFSIRRCKPSLSSYKLDPLSALDSSSLNRFSISSTCSKFIPGITINLSLPRNCSISKSRYEKKVIQTRTVPPVRSVWIQSRFAQRNKKSISSVRFSRTNEFEQLTLSLLVDIYYTVDVYKNG